MQRSQKSNNISIPGKTSKGTSVEEVQQEEMYVGSPRSAPKMVPLKNVMQRVIDEVTDQDSQISLTDAFVVRADFAKLIKQFMKTYSAENNVVLIEQTDSQAAKKQTTLAQHLTVFGGKGMTEHAKESRASHTIKKGCS